MLGQVYRLARAIPAVVRDESRQIFHVLPENTILVAESRCDAGRTVNVRCGDQDYWVFASDLDERGQLQTSASQAVSPGSIDALAH